MIDTVAVLAALAHQTRLDVLTLLSRGPSNGQTSGNLAVQAQVPPNSMSTHLQVLLHVGLVSARRSGRHVVYSIENALIDDLLNGLASRLNPDEQQDGKVRDYRSSITLNPGEKPSVLQTAWGDVFGAPSRITATVKAAPHP